MSVAILLPPSAQAMRHVVASKNNLHSRADTAATLDIDLPVKAVADSSHEI